MRDRQRIQPYVSPDLRRRLKAYAAAPGCATIQSYVKPEAVAGAQQRRVLSVLEGVRLAS